MSIELHIPDQPEVPISVGDPPSAQPRPHVPWHLRLRDASSAYLPLLVMALLALASWWLVKNSPRPLAAPEERPVSGDPDYTMRQFALERFDAAGKLKLRIEGAEMRHFPATDRIEIDTAQIRAIAPDGRVTLAHARQAIGNGDGSEVQLLGGAEVTSTDAHGQPLLMRGEFLHAFLVTERVRSHLPVVVKAGSSEMRAAGLDYDHATGRMDLKGPLRGLMAPRATARTWPSAASRPSLGNKAGANAGNPGNPANPANPGKAGKAAA